MRGYPQYRLEHFISLHYYEGGLSTSQVSRMFDFLIEERNEEIKFQAALRGVNLDDKDGKKESQTNEVVPVFGDPDDYKDMSAEEREKLTEDMMKKHKTWVASKGGSAI